MPKPSELRLIKRCRLFRPKDGEKPFPHKTRGLYALYTQARPNGKKKRFDLVYIGIAGRGDKPHRGINARLNEHRAGKKDWTHYSFFEVHDNIGGNEILELEGLLLHIFRHDPRIELENKQIGSNKLKRVSGKEVWES